MNNTNSGHAKNVANLSRLTQVIATLGNAYNPGNNSISKQALLDLEADSEAKLAEVEAALADWRNATNTREIAFDELVKFSTRLLAVLKSFPVAQPTVDDLAALVHSIRGEGKLTKADAGKTTTPDPAASGGGDQGTAEEKSVSTARVSFDARLETFGRMVILLQKERQYASNESAFSLSGLQNKLEELRTLNEAANNAYAVLKAARISRNLFFYQQANGLLDTVKQVKSYVKALHGADSQHYKAVAQVRFTRVVPAKKAK